MGPRAILSRLLVVLTLALFVAPQEHADRSAARTGPVAESQIEQARGIRNVQRQLLCAQVPGDDTPDLAGLVAALHAPPAPVALRISGTLLPATFRILPPVRGPPAA